MNSLLVGLVLTIASVGVDPKAPAQSHVYPPMSSPPWVVYGTLPVEDGEDENVMPLANFKTQMECEAAISQHGKEVMERYKMTLECKQATD